jgi:hypothetical protein
MKRRDLLGAALALPALSLTARAAAEDFAWIIGEWRGDGSFMGRPSKAVLIAAPALGGRFLELRWQLAGYEGRGLCGGGRGHWYDSTGAIRPLTYVATTGSLVSDWGTAETERGQSRYALEGAVLAVEDKVFAAAGERVFATHRLAKV